jgi:hypothetical protein
MGIEQEQSDLGGIEVGYLRNSREWRRLIGRWTTLCRRHDMASLAPSVSKPSTVRRIGSKCRRGRNDRSE